MWSIIKSYYPKLFFLLGLLFVATSAIKGQTVPQGISFQAVINDDLGAPLQNQNIFLRILLSDGPDLKNIYYVEVQELQSDDLGQIAMVIGREAKGQDLLHRIPWAEKEIWMNIELLGDDGSAQLISQGSFMAVPFAFHAESAEKIIPTDTAQLRTDQSIIWNASGNYKTQPHVHYLGTADAKALYFKTNNTTRMVISSDGQTVYYTDPGLNGSDEDKTAYPVVIQGGEQGIFIEIQENRSSANNFLTFADPEGIHGTVEGQTAGEYYSSFDYLFPLSLKVFDIGVEVANGIAGGIEAGGLGGAASAAAAAKSINLVEIALAVAFKTADLIAWNIEVALTIGVSYTSGGADYAEWLEKSDPTLDFMAGEVIGVKNGKISRNTEEADHLMVVSSNPGVLGNLPAKRDLANFEKVAFKGQVPVFVVGQVNLGDYILPSGNNDGLAIAVAPDQLKAGDYKNLIGIAWQEALQAPVNLVNVAVGINLNDLSDKVDSIEQKLDLIMDYLKGDASLIEGSIVSHSKEKQPFIPSKIEEQSRLQPLLSDATYDQFFDENAAIYQQVFDQAQVILKNKGISLKKYPMLEKLFANPAAFYKAMRRDPRMQTYMGYFDREVLQAKDVKSIHTTGGE